MKVCPGCKASNSDDAGYCENCGIDLSTPRSGMPIISLPVDDRSDGQENLPKHPPALMKAGSLLLVVGVIGALEGANFPPPLNSYVLNGGNGLLEVLIHTGFRIPEMLALAGLISGVLTLLRRGFYASVILGILSCFAIGPVFITTAGSIIGTITVALNRRDFIPIFHGPPDKEKPCPICRHPLQWVNGYREWYCFNCKNYRKLPRSHFMTAPQPHVVKEDRTDDTDDSQ